jgi:hypothetical protein
MGAAGSRNQWVPASWRVKLVALPSSWEFQEGAWVARHGLTSAQYQAAFDDLVGNQGMQLLDVSGYGVNGQDFYAALWAKHAGAPGWAARHGMTSAQYQQAFDQLTAQGFHPVLVNGYTVNDQDRYAAIFQKGNVALRVPVERDHGFRRKMITQSGAT